MSRILTHGDVMSAAEDVAYTLLQKFGAAKTDRGLALYPVPRGGVPAAYALLSLLSRGSYIEADLARADVVVDDLVDSGATRDRIRAQRPDVPFVALFEKSGNDDWVVFPWEGNEAGSADDIPTRLLQYIGEDPTRGGLKETPARFLKAWKTYSAGYATDVPALFKVFDDGAEQCDELVLVKNIPVYSHCEHHLAPFFGVAHVGYIPNGKVVGLSKLSRVVDAFAKRLQVQERLTNQIADAIQEHLAPLGVGVVVECRHLCMEARGIQRQGSSTTTSAVRGALKTSPEARAEFMGLIR